VAPNSSTAQATVTFQAEQQALSASFQQLVAQGATPAQFDAWRQQNAARLAAQQQRAKAISASQPVQSIAYITDVDIPSGASQTMEDFITARADLYNQQAQVHNQQVQSTGTVNEAQVASTFQTQSAAALHAQTQRTQILAQEANQQPLPVPPPLEIPPGATSQMSAFLTLRDQLMRGEVQVHNQNLSLTTAAQKSALLQWRQQNASQFAQLRTLAQGLVPTAQN
jgi:hypothetical protein